MSNTQHLQLLVLRWPAGQSWAYLSQATASGLRFLRFIDLDSDAVFAALTRDVVPDEGGMCEVAYPATRHDHDPVADGGR